MHTNLRPPPHCPPMPHGRLMGSDSRTLRPLVDSLNIFLDVILAGYFGMGVAGIGLVAEWATALLGLFTLRILKQRSQIPINFGPILQFGYSKIHSNDKP